jgi:hypothetical protein
MLWIASVVALAVARADQKNSVSAGKNNRTPKSS